jgi:outer membrane protein
MHKNARRVLLALVVLHLFSAVAMAASDRVGYIDAQQILVSHPKYEVSQKHLDDFVKKKTEEAKLAAENEPDASKRMMIIDDARRESGNEEMKIMNPITAEINKVIEKVAKAKGVTIVLNKVLIYFGGVDLTEDVVKEVKALK